jgi:hypothetical protein
MVDFAYSGPGRLSFEPPDVVHVATVGDVSGEEMSALLREMGRLAAGCGHFFLLNDVSKMGTLTPEGRKRATEEVDALALRGIAVYGAAFSQRVVATLMARLLNMFARASDRPIAIVETEAQARAWIARRRKQLVGG